MSYPPPPPPGPPQPPYGYGGYPPQYPQYQPPPQIDSKLLRPSSLWYWLSAIPAIVGITISIVLLVQVINRFDTDFDRFTSPAPVTVTLDEGDERGIYLQTFGAQGARPPSAFTASCSVRNTSTEQPVPLKDTSGFTLTINNDEFVEKQRFVAPAGGQYVVRCSEPSGVPLAVGPHLAFRQFWGPIIGMIASGLIGVILTAVIAVVTAVRRSNHKQRLVREAREAQARGA